MGVQVQSVLATATLPHVDVRVVLFTIGEGSLLVALERQGDLAGLPTGVPAPEEALDGAATRVLAERTGLEERYIEQLYTVSQNTPEEWTVTVTYLGLVLAGTAASLPNVEWYEATHLPAMAPLDRRIIDYALLRLRAKLGYTTIAFHLLPRTFSLSELQQVYEAVLDRRLDKRNFRRRVQAAAFLDPTGETRRDGSHRPARLFRFRAAHDAETYLTPAWTGYMTRAQETS